jgi:hypothetical protein
MSAFGGKWEGDDLMSATRYAVMMLRHAKRLTTSFERRSGIRNADICELARGFYPSDARLGAATRERTVSRPDLPDAFSVSAAYFSTLVL